MTARRDRTLEIAEGFRLLPDHQPAQQGAERRPQCRRRGGDRRDRRLYRQRLRRRPRLADLPRRQDGGEQSRGLRRAQFPAARGQSGAGCGRGGARRADACADQRRGRRAHRRLQHGVPPRRAAGSSAASIRSTAPPATMSTSAGGFRTPATRSASARPPWSGISAATRWRPIAASSAATARPRRSSMRSTRSASTCSGRRSGSAASTATSRPRCCCRAGPSSIPGCSGAGCSRPCTSRRLH